MSRTNQAPAIAQQPSGDSPMLGLMLRLIAMIVLAIMFSLVKMAGNHGVHVVESLFWRQLAGLPVVILWLWWTGDLNAIRTKHPGAHAIRAMLGIMAMALNFTAMILLPLAEATTIGFATPIFATLLAALLLGEPTGRFRWTAIGLGFAGVLIAVRPGGGEVHPVGAAVALAGALLTSGVAIQLRRMAKEENTGAIVFWFSLCSLAPLGIGMIFFARAHDLQTWAIIAGLSGAGAVAQILLTAALRHASVAAILTMDYSSLIWSILFGYIVFGEVPADSIWFGAPVIIAAGLSIVWREQFLAKQKTISKT